MASVRTLLMFLAAFSLVACGTGRRGGRGGGDDDDSVAVGDDDDSVALGDDDTATGDDDDTWSTTHWGEANGTLVKNDTSEPCAGPVEANIDESGQSSGWAVCGAANGWTCTATWSHAYAFAEEQAVNSAIVCDETPDGAIPQTGEVWLWGDPTHLGGQFSTDPGLFDWVSVSIDASLPN